jgi:hypothetical protein
VGKDHTPWLVSTAKQKFKFVIRGSLLVSALINIGHVWEYKVVEDLAISSPLYRSNYAQVNGRSYSDYPLANQSLLYLIFSIMYFCINFGLFFILNTGLEVKIVFRMRKELKEKRERLRRMHAANALVTTSERVSKIIQNFKVNEEHDDIKERRVIRMVVFNSVFNFVLRATEMLFWMENASIWMILFPGNVLSSIGTAVHGILSFIADIGYLAYILTFSTNFLIFYKFNAKFRDVLVFFRASNLLI